LYSKDERHRNRTDMLIFGPAEVRFKFHQSTLPDRPKYLMTKLMVPKWAWSFCLWLILFAEVIFCQILM